MSWGILETRKDGTTEYLVFGGCFAHRLTYQWSANGAAMKVGGGPSPLTSQLMASRRVVRILCRISCNLMPCRTKRRAPGSLYHAWRRTVQRAKEAFRTWDFHFWSAPYDFATVVDPPRLLERRAVEECPVRYSGFPGLLRALLERCKVGDIQSIQSRPQWGAKIRRSHSTPFAFDFLPDTPGLDWTVRFLPSNLTTTTTLSLLFFPHHQLLIFSVVSFFLGLSLLSPRPSRLSPLSPRYGSLCGSRLQSVHLPCPLSHQLRLRAPIPRLRPHFSFLSSRERCVAPVSRHFQLLLFYILHLHLHLLRHSSRLASFCSCQSRDVLPSWKFVHPPLYESETSRSS